MTTMKVSRMTSIGWEDDKVAIRRRTGRAERIAIWREREREWERRRAIGEGVAGREVAGKSVVWAKRLKLRSRASVV